MKGKFVFFNPEDQEQLLDEHGHFKKWIFRRSSDVDNNAFHFYAEGGVNNIIEVLTCFDCPVKEISEELFFIKEFKLMDYYCLDTDSYILERYYGDLPYDRFDIFDNFNYKLCLYDEEADYNLYPVIGDTINVKHIFEG